MQRAKLADLFIDTPLVNAHTSATDVLWAGVPMITLPRSAMISRVAASVLTANGLPHLIARNLEVRLTPSSTTALLLFPTKASSLVPSFSALRITPAWLLRSRELRGGEELRGARVQQRRTPGKRATCLILKCESVDVAALESWGAG
jgi:hypothetical protein